jgi:hypothetical protein
VPLWIAIERQAMTKRFDPASTALSAIANASAVVVTRDDLPKILANGTGEPSHVRALFSDVSLSTLLRLAIAYEITDADLARAYARARQLHAAANPELDAFMREVAPS